MVQKKSKKQGPEEERKEKEEEEPKDRVEMVLTNKEGEVIRRKFLTARVFRKGIKTTQITKEK